MMIFLFFLFLFSIIFTFYTKYGEKNKGIVFSLLILFLIILESIRFKSGVDFSMYYNSFTMNASEGDRFEWAYTLLEDTIRYFTLNYTFFLFVNSIIIYGIYYFIFKKNFTYPIITLYFLVVYNIGMLGSNRQVIATALCFLALDVLTQKELKYNRIIFFVLVFLASSFHTSAIIFVIIVLFNIKLNFLFWGIALIFAFLLNLNDFNIFLVNKLKVFLPINLEYRIDLYLRETKELSYLTFVLGVIRRLIPIILIISFKKILENKVNYYLVKNILFFSLFFYLFSFFHFSFLSSRVPYFLYIEIIIYTWLIEESFIRNIKYKNYVLILFILMGILFFYKNISQYIHLFIPYNTIFSLNL